MTSEFPSSATPKRRRPKGKPSGHPDKGQVGLAARHMAVAVVERVLTGGETLDQSFDPETGAGIYGHLSQRDRALIRNLATATLRHLGGIDAIIKSQLSKKLPPRSGASLSILRVAVAQIFLLDVPDHAAVDLANRLARSDRKARHFQSLINGVLRSILRSRGELEDVLKNPDHAAPDWLRDRWRLHYGAETAAAMLTAHLTEPPLDLTLKAPAKTTAERDKLPENGVALPNGTLRLMPGTHRGPITKWPGYTAGHWWVQDVAASLPVELLGTVKGKRVLELAAAPGGKTAQLASRGADIVAVDKSAKRLERVTENLNRLGLTAHRVAADIRQWSPETLSGTHQGWRPERILLDAPCTATGTIRRHPDIAWQRRLKDVNALAELQSQLLERAASWLPEGGLLVYATCSLEPEEGLGQITRLLARDAGLRRLPIEPREIYGLDQAVTEDGDVRTRPEMNFPGAEGGMDGFFISRIERHGTSA